MVWQVCQPKFKKQWTAEDEKLVETVLKTLNDENLALKISKCELFKNQVDWLENHLSESGVKPKFTKTSDTEIQPTEITKTGEIVSE